MAPARVPLLTPWLRPGVVEAVLVVVGVELAAVGVVLARTMALEDAIAAVEKVEAGKYVVIGFIAIVLGLIRAQSASADVVMGDFI